MDIYHNYGNDLKAGVTGDLLLASDRETAQQRIIRRLLTPPGSYIAHPDYGAGLAQYVGLPLSLALEKQIKAIITTQMFNETSVSKSPSPIIQLTPTLDGLACFIQYAEVASSQIVTLNFQVSK